MATLNTDRSLRSQRRRGRVTSSTEIDRDQSRRQDLARRGTHGFGYGVTGAELRARIAARQVCPSCVGTGHQWCLHTRRRVRCALCSGGALATHAIRTFAPVAPLLPPQAPLLEEAA